MLFNTLDFAIFLPTVFILYWFVFNKKLLHQNLLVVLASYFFYGWWDWRFLFLIIFSTLIDYVIGLKLGREHSLKKRKLFLWISILVNIGSLGFFKYYNFFIESFNSTFTFFGSEIEGRSLNIILPIGISFYTFQTLSYTIDIYRNNLKPTRDFISFAAFVSFFPQLVAGPIERATNLLPQILNKRSFARANAVDGLRQILWGLFKKIVIADNCAIYANLIFDNSDQHSGSTLVMGALFFAFQIYGDFSGYSDIAIGSSRLFGINLKQNFAFPYFSRDIAEFWRRWHISLSTWFRDYLYIPLGGSRGGTWMKIRNTFLIFLISGFWHGANWTFVVWGALHAIFFLPLLLAKTNRTHIEVVAKNSYFPSLKEFFQISITFTFTIFAWIFFRAESLHHAFNYIEGIFSLSIISKPSHLPLMVLILILFFFIIEWIGRRQQYAIEIIGFKWKKSLRWGFYLFIAMLIFLFDGNDQVFIYFQF